MRCAWLVVNDCSDTAETLAAYLRHAGYSVATADEGSAALALVQRLLPHCVPLDVNIPSTNGLDLARHIRAQFGDDILLIAVTG